MIDLDRPVADNVRAVAESFDRQPIDITALVLDRPRHHDLIEELRAAGTRIKLIGDGTVTASISAAIRGTNDHLSIGIGGTRQAVLSAAALRCLGGGLQAQLWPTSRSQIEAARELGVEDVDTRLHARTTSRRGDVIVVATGVTNGDLLRGVRFLADSARTHSLVMCMRCNWVRFTDGIHFFARERREEVGCWGDPAREAGFRAADPARCCPIPRRRGAPFACTSCRGRRYSRRCAATAGSCRPCRVASTMNPGVDLRPSILIRSPE